jgi:cysteinyl-tRNA synthetase
MKKKTIRTIEFEKIPAIGIMVGIDHFNYGSGKTRRSYILMLPFITITFTVVKRVFNTVKDTEKERLRKKQQEAVRNKNYDEAALIRDEMKRKGILS